MSVWTLTRRPNCLFCARKTRKEFRLAILPWVRTIAHFLRDQLYPPRCPGCGRVGTLYCSACFDAVPRIVPPICELCGQPLSAPGRHCCSRCGRTPLQIDGIRSAALFKGSLREAIHRLKYGYAADMAVPLGKMLLAFWQNTPLSADVLVPIPLHPHRERARGYNQADLLARQLAAFIERPVWRNVLQRRKNTLSQTQLNAEQRQENVRGAFSCTEAIRGKRVLLIDDVCTTGATLSTCAQAALAAGAKAVYGLTVTEARGSL